MTNLEKLILSTYSDSDGKGLITIIRKADLESLLERAISKIEIAQKEDQETLVALAGTILTGINTKIGKLQADDKKRLEYLLADLFDTYFRQIKAKPDGPALVAKITKSLQSCCELNGYNFGELERILQLEKHVILPPKRTGKSLPFYESFAPKQALNNLIGDIQSKEWIKSIREFKKMFSPIPALIQVECNRKKRAHILILFQVLKEKELIQPKNTSGHFSPLAQYAVDNGVFLYKNPTPNRQHERLKRKMDQHLTIRKEVEDLINKNDLKKSG